MRKEYIKPEVLEIEFEVEDTFCNVSGTVATEPEEGGSVEGELPEGDKWD